MKTIETRFHGWTNKRAAKYTAWDEEHRNKITLPVDDNLNIDQNHMTAAAALCLKMGWAGTLQGGHTQRGMVWCFIDEDEQIKVRIDPGAPNLSRVTFSPGRH